MNRHRILNLVATVTLIVAATATTSYAIKSQQLEQGKKCECFDGAATCFFDGIRCPVSKGKCKCFQAPKSQPEEAHSCCLSENRTETNGQADTKTAFCLAICPVKVGGVTCGAECQRKKGHSGKHLCVKLHSF